MVNLAGMLVISTATQAYLLKDFVEPENDLIIGNPSCTFGPRAALHCVEQTTELHFGPINTQVNHYAPATITEMHYEPSQKNCELLLISSSCNYTDLSSKISNCAVLSPAYQPN